MTLEEFIKKLKTFPPKDRLRFYCPTNKKFYYINRSHILTFSTIYLNRVMTCLPEHNTYEYWIDVYTELTDHTNDKEEIKLNVNGQEFKFL